MVDDSGPVAVVHLHRSSQRTRVVDAALGCIARQGIHKTTADDVARQAGLSRATLYRAFPGGKEAVLSAAVQTEVARLFSGLAVVMGEPSDLEGALVAGMVEAARQLSDHPALRTLLAEEPGVVLPHLAFERMDRVLRTATDFTAPFLARWLEPDEAGPAAEWAVRVFLSYVACPRPGADLTDVDDARHLVDTFVVPGIEALRSGRRISGDQRGRDPRGRNHGRKELRA